MIPCCSCGIDCLCNMQDITTFEWVLAGYCVFGGLWMTLDFVLAFRSLIKKIKIKKDTPDK